MMQICSCETCFKLLSIFLFLLYWLVQSESLLCEISLPCGGRRPVSLLLYWLITYCLVKSESLLCEIFLPCGGRPDKHICLYLPLILQDSRLLEVLSRCFGSRAKTCFMEIGINSLFQSQFLILRFLNLISNSFMDFFPLRPNSS